MADSTHIPESDDPAKRMVFAYATPLEVRAAASASDDDLLKIAKQRAADSKALDEFEPFFFRIVPSTNKVDSYFTKMSPSSLKNYADDFAEGRAFQDSHRHDEMPLGYSLTGTFVGAQGNGAARVESDVFIARGISAAGDAAINRIRTGTVRDVSIGFYGGEWICSICGRDMLSDWDCWHIPGMSYSADEKDMDFFWATETARAPKVKPAEPVDKTLCTAAVENAHAAECSGVYDGATPGAIVKAQRMADGGRLTPAMARSVEQQFHVRIHGADQTWRGWTPPAVSPRVPNPKEGAMTLDEQIRELLALGADADPLDAVRALKERSENGETALRGIRATVKTLGAPDDADAGKWAAGEIERLRPLADDGKRYRDDLITNALEEGVRAHGSEFQQELYRGVLVGSSLDAIKRFRDDWKATGDRFFQGSAKQLGGRLTGDDESGKPVSLDTRRKPRRAYAGT